MRQNAAERPRSRNSPLTTLGVPVRLPDDDVEPEMDAVTLAVLVRLELAVRDADAVTVPVLDRLEVDVCTRWGRQRRFTTVV